MTDRRDDLVEAFLADLGAADVPEAIATSAMRRIRDERPERGSRVSPWLAAAALLALIALAGLGWVVAGPRPSPLPEPSVPPSASAPAPTPSSSVGPTPSPVASPTPGASPSAPVLGTWDVTLPGTDGGKTQLALQVVDRSGMVTFAAAATRLPAGSAAAAPNALVFGPGIGDRVIVGWIGGACDERGVLDLDPDGRTFTLRLPQPVGCDAIGIGWAVELTFGRAVDPAAFKGTWRNDLVRVEDVAPTAVAFVTPQHGWVGGSTRAGDAIVLETIDGGATWRVGRLGSGEVSEIGVGGPAVAWAGRVCIDAAPTCHPGLYRYDESGMWGLAAKDWPLRLSFAGVRGAALFLSADAPRSGSGIPRPELRLTEDGGETWAATTAPCPASLTLGDAVRVDASTILAVCESEGATGNSLKEIRRSKDGGQTWSKLADGPYSGTQLQMDVLADGTGWMWGPRSHLLATTDGGATWTPLDVADGDVRIVYGADAWGGGAGVILVWDPDRQATLLLRTDDGRSWTEVYAWPTQAP